MTASLLAAFFFALTATCGSYNVRANGPVRGNIGRLCVAAVVLGVFAHTWGNGFASASVAWFLFSGVLGMGIGDIGVYAALPLLGSRLTVLMTQCLAAPIAAVGEWLWLGTRLTAAQMLWGVVILGGVVLALMPSKSSPPRVTVRPIGYVFGVIAAIGQGIGALLSRKGVMVASAAGETVQSPVFGVNAAYHRIFAGLVFVVLWFALMRAIGRMPVPVTPPTREHGFKWIVASGLSGSVLGVGCYQWALATSPSGLVLPIAATAPLLAMPITYWLEGDRPTRRAVVGGIVAVAGCVALAAAR